MPSGPSLPRINPVDFYRLVEDEFLLLLAQAFDNHLKSQPAAKLAPRQQAIAAYAQMLIDVPNGGFAQFFYNRRGDDGVLAAAKLLDELGVPKAADLLRAAQKVYRKHKSAFNVANPFDKLFGSIAEFEKLDQGFDSIALKGTRAIEVWARQNISKLAVADTGKPIDPNFTGEIEVMQPNGLVGQYLGVKKGRPSGAYREFFDDGSVRRAVFYKAGKISGDFWPNGQLKKKESKQGKLTLIEWFYPSGKVQKRFVRNKDGDAVEPVRLYHENGQLAEELHLAKSGGRGPWLKFFDDGSLKLQAEHDQRGMLIVHNAWDDDRRQVVKNGNGTFHDNGRRISPWYAVFFNGDWPETSELKAGIRHGTSTIFRDGVVWSVSHYREGILHGDSSMHWENGRVRSVTTFVDGKEGKTRNFPKFDKPAPAVLLKVEANERLYSAWQHIAVDEYPRPLNLAEVQSSLKIPAFLDQVHQRNQSGKLTSDYEDANTFKDGITYFLIVNETGEVMSAQASGSGMYSHGEWDTYVPLLKQLRFTPGRVRSRAVQCHVAATVDHTFVEGKGRKDG